MDVQRRVFESVFEMLPSEENPSPIVRVNHFPASGDFALYAKLEWMNPIGSVKDRAAWSLLRDLEERGELDNGRTIVEPTSGNTGLSLAALASARGHQMHAIVPGKVPEEKKLLLRLAGAALEVVNDQLCPSPGLGDGSINLAKTHAKASPDRYVLPNQYENEQNVEAHIRTTGPEIWRQTEGRITHLFVSLGTCGTVTGCAKFLREKNPNVRIIAVQPTDGHDIPGLRKVDELASTKLFDRHLIDDILEVDHELAYRRAMELFRTQALPAGPSCGLIYEGAQRIIERDGEGFGVMIFPDNVFKYTSTMMKHLADQLTDDAAPTASAGTG